MNAQVKEEWIQALESGKYIKGTGQLRNEDGSMCCLGVLGHIKNMDTDENGYHFTEMSGDKIGMYPQLQKFDIDDRSMCILANINDGTNDFEKVIEYIKTNL